MMKNFLGSCWLARLRRPASLMCSRGTARGLDWTVSHLVVALPSIYIPTCVGGRGGAEGMALLLAGFVPFSPGISDYYHHLRIGKLRKVFRPNPSNSLPSVVLILCEPQFALFRYDIENLDASDCS